MCECACEREEAIGLVAWMGTKTVDCRSSFLSAAECLDVSVRVRASGEVYVNVCVCVLGRQILQSVFSHVNDQ